VFTRFTEYRILFHVLQSLYSVALHLACWHSPSLWYQHTKISIYISTTSLRLPSAFTPSDPSPNINFTYKPKPQTPSILRPSRLFQEPTAPSGPFPPGGIFHPKSSFSIPAKNYSYHPNYHRKKKKSKYAVQNSSHC